MMQQFFVGGRIKDQKGIDWTITSMWNYENFLCMSLIGTFDHNLIGGHRVKLYEYNVFNF